MLTYTLTLTSNYFTIYNDKFQKGEIVMDKNTETILSAMLDKKRICIVKHSGLSFTNLQILSANLNGCVECRSDDLSYCTFWFSEVCSVTVVQ
jgi:hypothetical protein